MTAAVDVLVIGVVMAVWMVVAAALGVFVAAVIDWGKGGHREPR